MLKSLLINKYTFLFFVVAITIGYIFFFKDKIPTELTLFNNKLSITAEKPIKSDVIEKESIIIDSDDSEILLDSILVPEPIKKQLTLVNVKYYGFDSLIHRGQIIVNKSVEEDVIEIFEELLKEKFPIEKVIPIKHYNWNDDLSMQDNNTSSFNYRKIANSNRMSAHSLGLAIDINPRINPYIKGEKISPSNGSYSRSKLGTITDSTTCFKIFKKYGWKWGGNWRYSKDYQHFSKSGR